MPSHSERTIEVDFLCIGSTTEGGENLRDENRPVRPLPFAFFPREHRFGHRYRHFLIALKSWCVVEGNVNAMRSE